MSEFVRVLSRRLYKKHGYQLVKYIVDGDKYGSKDFEMVSSFSWPDEEYIGDKDWARSICVKRGIYPQTIEGTIRGAADVFERLPMEEQAARLLVGYNALLTFSPCCSIGFCKGDGKWYGWSHRAMFGFQIGDSVKKGDCAYEPSDPEDMLGELIDFYDDDKDSEHAKKRVLTKRASMRYGDTEEYARLMKLALEERARPQEPPQQDAASGTMEAKMQLDTPEDLEKRKGQIGVYWETETVRKKGGERLTRRNFHAHPEPWGRGEWTATTAGEAREMAIAFARGVS